jgi:hypothetical protein
VARSAKHSGRRSRNFKDEPIDVGELAGMSNVDGMLSFLDRKPDEYARLFREARPADSAEPPPSPAASESASGSGAPEVTAAKPNAPAADASSDLETNTIPEVDAPELAAPLVERPISATPISEPLNIGAPNSDAPGRVAEPAPALPGGLEDRRGTPELPLAKVGAPDLTALEVSATESASAVFAAPICGAPDLSEAYVYRPRRQPLRLASSAEDGHTRGEQALLDTLRRLAKPSTQGNFRIIAIGERTLAGEARMAYSTVQENLRALERKLAIEIRARGPQQPKAYIVYPDDEILRRRQAVGLTHVIRRTSGVSLVNPEQGITEA